EDHAFLGDRGRAVRGMLLGPSRSVPCPSLGDRIRGPTGAHCGTTNYFFRATEKYDLMMYRIVGHGAIVARRRRSRGRELCPISAIPTPGIAERRVRAVPAPVQQQVSTVE